MEIEEVTGRIAQNLEHLKRYTATPGDRCTRLPFTKEAREAAEYLKSLMTEAGLEVREDAAGNVIGVMKGEDPALPCVMMGSHYDSVVNGGDFDGIAGAVCAIEVARQLKEKGVTPKRNFVAVGFCDEGGCAVEPDTSDPEQCLETGMWSIAKNLKTRMAFLSMTQ